MDRESHNRANAKYRSKSVKQINLAFYPKEQYLYEFVCLHENKAGYIKGLIERDMEENGGGFANGSADRQTHCSM